MNAIEMTTVEWLAMMVQKYMLSNNMPRRTSMLQMNVFSNPPPPSFMLGLGAG